jgi:hypothetical protein
MVEVTEYIGMESEKLPYETQWGALVDELSVFCPKCENKTTENKYRFNEFAHSLDVIAVGFCHECSLVVSAKPFRLYDDGRVVYKLDGGEWVECKESSFIQKIINKIKMLLKID